ncbi:MAG: hypothetical protein MJH08_10435 [Hyphomicrobiales bacterium]|nr:hypothetical protein [Hyphomicrobiales bacterium]
MQKKLCHLSFGRLVASVLMVSVALPTGMTSFAPVAATTAVLATVAMSGDAMAHHGSAKRKRARAARAKAARKARRARAARRTKARRAKAARAARAARAAKAAKAAKAAEAAKLAKLAEAKKQFQSPDILVLGDSQMAFGSGRAFLEFFQDIKNRCQPNSRQKMDLEQLNERSVGVIGVRSSSLHSWVAREGKLKDKVCKVDRKWRSNAATFGTINTTRNKYVQIGEGAQYQFCAKDRSPFEVMFENGYYKPKLLVLSFLGNSAHRWAGNKKNALQDVERTMAQLPSDTPCIFMTTAPAYKKKTVKLRHKAQQNIKYAFEKKMSRCSFVEGYTAQTVAANQGNKQHFRLRKSGRVKDPFHPNRKAAEKFLEIEKTHICRAVFAQLGNQQHAKLDAFFGPR